MQIEKLAASLNSAKVDFCPFQLTYLENFTAIRVNAVL